MSNCQLEDVQKMHDIVTGQGFMNANTAGARKIAVGRLSEVLEDENRTCEYVLNNLDIVKHRFQNLNDAMTGATVDIYAKRAVLAINDYLSWKKDRLAWEKGAANKGTKSSGDGEKKAKPAKVEKQVETAPAAVVNSNTRLVAVPIRADFDVSMVIPKDITINEVRKIAYVLAGMVANYDPTIAKAIQEVLDFKPDNQGMNG